MSTLNSDTLKCPSCKSSFPDSMILVDGTHVKCENCGSLAVLESLLQTFEENLLSKLDK